VALVFAGIAPAITPPKDALGFNLGDDYKVANYTQLEAYWKKLAAESDRMKLVDIGTTAEGRRQYMAIVSSPENIRNLERYKSIARRLALAEGLTDDQARALARDGKAVGPVVESDGEQPFPLPHGPHLHSGLPRLSRGHEVLKAVVVDVPGRGDRAEGTPAQIDVQERDHLCSRSPGDDLDVADRMRGLALAHGCDRVVGTAVRVEVTEAR